MTVTPLRRGPSGGPASHPPPHLQTLPTHVVLTFPRRGKFQERRADPAGPMGRSPEAMIRHRDIVVHNELRRRDGYVYGRLVRRINATLYSLCLVYPTTPHANGPARPHVGCLQLQPLLRRRTRGCRGYNISMT